MQVRDILRQNIRDIREDRGMTQAEVSEKLGITPAGYAKLERGETQVSAERLYQLSKIFNVSIEEFIKHEGEGIILFNQINDNQHFNVNLGIQSQEGQVAHLNEIILIKNELLNARVQEIESLKQTIDALKQTIIHLENTINTL